MNEAGDIDAINLPLEPTLTPLKFRKGAKPKSISSEELTKYIGDYELGGAVVKIYSKDNKTLFALVPGQPDYELVPVDKNKFALKVNSGYYVQFDTNEKEEISGLTFLQPN